MNDRHNRLREYEVSNGRQREREGEGRRSKQPEVIAFIILAVKHVKENKHCMLD